ncbi:hypothetical protein UPYG_G00129790 [Umbra pygmaea]|uniref:Uncharacterized protein n=1 Tax=Umbra pygmaea TaxID=75934 RepID=A0ABD0X6S4_UMBPY
MEAASGSELPGISATLGEHHQTLENLGSTIDNVVESLRWLEALMPASGTERSVTAPIVSPPPALPVPATTVHLSLPRDHERDCVPGHSVSRAEPTCFMPPSSVSLCEHEYNLDRSSELLQRDLH